MNTGLLDLLTLQQAQKSDYSNAGNSKSVSGVISENQQTFKSYLDDKKDDAGEIAATVFDNIQNYNSQTPDIADISGDTSNFEEQLNSLISLIKSPDKIEDSKELQAQLTEQIKNILKALKESGIPIDENNPVASLLALQKDGGKALTPQIENIIKTQTGGSLTDLISKIALSNLTDNIVNNISNSANDTAAGNATTQQNQAESVSTIIAGQIIDIAKTDAKEQPETVKTDIKSEQIASLLNGVTKKDGENKKSSETQNTDKMANIANGDKTTMQNMMRDIDNNNSHNKTLSADDALNEQSNLQPKDGQHKGDSDSYNDEYKNLLSHLYDEQSDKASATASNDIIKFQKYIDSVSNMAQASNAARVAKAEDVMAQIKFGLSSMAGSNNGNIIIQLSPKELGSVDVKMEIGEDGKTKVAIMAEKTETLNLLQKDTNSLKEMLQDALQTSSTNLSFSFHSNNGDEQWKQFFNNNFSGNSRYGSNNDEIENINPTAMYHAGFSGNDRLDIRV